MMVLAVTVVGEFGLCSLLLCEEVEEVEVALVAVMETVLVSLLLSLTTITEEMFFYRQLVEMQLQFHNLRQHSIVM
jgi:hypothetical protein